MSFLKRIVLRIDTLKTELKNVLLQLPYSKKWNSVELIGKWSMTTNPQDFNWEISGRRTSEVFFRSVFENGFSVLKCDCKSQGNLKNDCGSDGDISKSMDERATLIGL